jgi:protoporphyrinogen oxidase
VAVLGAGCTGLAAARRLLAGGAQVVVLEKGERPGGLAGGVLRGENLYEYGPHMFHTADPEIMADVKGLMGPELIVYNRTIKIKFGDAFFDFPLSMTDVVTKLPLTTVTRAGLSWAWHSVFDRLRRPAQENSETVLKRYYGQVLYEIFFQSYIMRVWGIGPERFSPAFARQRIPRMQIMEFLGGLARKLTGQKEKPLATDGFVETMDGTFYSTNRGFALITDRMAEEIIAGGGRVLLEAQATGIIHESGRVTAVVYRQDGREHTLACAGLVNTAPVNLAVDMLDPPAPGPVRAAAGRLRYRPTVFVGFLVRRTKVLPSSIMYFREHSFNRVSDLSQFGIEVSPPGHTVLVAEIACEQEERPWQDHDFAAASVLGELQAEGLLTPADVVETHVYRSLHAYPVYLLGYEEDLRLCLDALEALPNLATAGRQGRFQYVNAHVAFKMGQEAAARVLRGMTD